MRLVGPCLCQQSSTALPAGKLGQVWGTGGLTAWRPRGLEAWGPGKTWQAWQASTGPLPLLRSRQALKTAPKLVHNDSPPPAVIDVYRPPTPPLQLPPNNDGQSRLYRVLHSIESTTSAGSADGMDRGTSLQARHIDGTARRPSAPPLAVPQTLTGFIIHAKTSAAVPTTAPITATATTTTTTTTTTTATASTTSLSPGAPLGTESNDLPPFAPSASGPHLPISEQPPVSEPQSLEPPSSSREAMEQTYSEPTRGARLLASSAEIPSVTYSFPSAPLLQDPSLYVTGHREAESEGTSLDELAHLVRLAKYQERKRAQTRLRLQLTLISTALSARLVRCGEMAQRNLAECFQADDRSGFANLYNALHNVRKSCDELRKYALLEPEIDSFRSSASIGGAGPTGDSFGPGRSGPGSASMSHFLNDIPADASDTFISFLTTIRNNPDYLATRLCTLTASELAALARFYQGTEPVDSVLPFHHRHSSLRGGASGKPQAHRYAATNTSARDPDYVQKLLSFQRHDPLSALLHTCFANSAGPDSTEDKRRTSTWASACARLISEKGAAGEPVLTAVMNAWSSMRGWAGRSNMEWFLMKILQDGAFLLDRAEDQNGTRFNLYEWTSKDHIAAEEFYDRAINDLFDVIDDEDATGVPEGLIELGNQILGKLDPQLADSTRNWFVCKWLFGVWLLGVIVHPETHGLMNEYHITEYGRQKILKEVALRAQSLLIERTTSIGNSKAVNLASTHPTIRIHIENIMNKFHGLNTRSPPTRLLPARSITSLRETAEVHPYLVLSPADLVTLVNALFPDRRPRSGQSSSNRSGPGSVSGFSCMSQPVVTNLQRTGTDNYTSLSASVSSTTSDATTSVEPLLDDQRPGISASRLSPPSSVLSGQDRRPLNSYEDDGYRLHLAVNEMVHTLGRDVVAGFCHPCAERWAVIFISADGNRLSLQTTFDGDDDPEEDAASSSIETDEDTDDAESDLEIAELDKDYHQLRDSILKLVEDYEIPPGLELEGSHGSTYSNRANRRKKYRLKNSQVIFPGSAPRLQSRNPYWRQAAPPQPLHNGPQSAHNENSGKPSKSASSDDMETRQSVLIAMLTAASSQSRAQSDFLSAHLYWRTIQQLNSLTVESLRRNGFAALLNIFSRGPRDTIRKSDAAVEEYDAWLIWLRQSQERVEGLIETMMRRLRALRDKMWYVTDVRNSGPYEFSRNIAVALKTMGTSRKWDAYRRVRQSLPRGPAASYLYRTESEIVELLAAVEEEGGPNKLSDDQAEKTIRWLDQFGIENFCRGEERIHRFCCEIGSCVDKLIGGSLMDAPVLWASDLYTRDRQYLERNNRTQRDCDGNSSLVWDDGSSVMSFGELDSRRHSLSSRSSSAVRGDPRARPSQRNPSLQSYDSGQYGFSRASTSLSDILDTEVQFSGRSMSPVSAIDTATTYWSPFQASISPSVATSRTQSPTTSVSNLSSSFSQLNRRPYNFDQGNLHSRSSHHSAGRPGSSVSSVDTVLQRRISDDKALFLDELRQTLTSLLLSDLGTLVFSRGSETDAWFENLGQECINRRETMAKRQRQEKDSEQKPKSTRYSPKQVVIDTSGMAAPLTNSGSLAGSDGSRSTSSNHSSYSPSTDDMRGRPAETLGTGQETESLQTKNSLANSASRTRREMKDFPYTKSYHRLLRLFCVHPNPYAKLSALLELENLIVASLSSRSTRRRLALLTRSGLRPVISSNSSPAGTQPGEDPAVTPPISRAKPLEDTIDNVKGRRSSTFSPSLFSASPMSPRRGGPYGGAVESRPGIAASGSANKDAILTILVSLFREASMRPKTLFRDLQFIASFVPPDVLDQTESGKAFWNAGLAALLLKKEVCSTMVEVADEIVGVYTKTRKGSASASGGSADSSKDGSSTSSHARSPTIYSLADAARMWTITAKEGDPTSQRELAIFYLSNPELVERTTLPLSKPHEVFKKAVMEKYGGSGGGSRYHQHQASGISTRGTSSSASGGNHGASGGSGSSGIAAGVSDVRNDPALMCVAIHWMEAAEQGGDELARTFLNQSNEMMKTS
ncbi:hypothetical protein CMQ_7580 [Grosmannia clavigera kw1407]|uniref:Uncharacterized protein n=1 Tax=Grosmannia clavigera (strain kw1407 / UAMH 11150) TaxID=655863 RepID=F0XNW7_GROCL|nr:uncharacterized protein CMQ_7580 [Grosmannia clavigera kw1407]EFX00578.1 hypothetical protein CMQ_7580 [Grosmannia clavigera kw1407]